MTHDLRLHLHEQQDTGRINSIRTFADAQALAEDYLRQALAPRTMRVRRPPPDGYGADILALLEMTERYGLDTVHTWLRNLAATQGRSLCK